MSTNGDAPILICYDRSDGARRALEQVAELFPGARTLVLNVWSFPVMVSAYGAGDATAYSRKSQEELAVRDAETGCAIARELGLDASPLTACGSSEGTWHTILRVADERDVSLIVVGARGLTGLRSMFLGSVSHGVVQHAQRPVLVVPRTVEARPETIEAPADVASQLESLS